MPLGGWSTYIPFNEEISKSYDVTNYFRDAIDNDKIYIVADHMDRIEKYIRDYYNVNASAKLVKEIYNYSVYSIVTE